MSDKATPRVCIFCGSDKDLEREHVWPDWLSRVEGMPARTRSTQVTLHEGESLADRSWAGPPFTMKVRRVCHDCNHGWMSDLEQAAKTLLIPLLQGRGRTLHQRGQRTLAAWAAKTAMVFEFTHPTILTIPQEHRTYLYEHGEPAPGTIVSLAPYDMRRYNAYYKQHPLRVYEGAVGPADHNAYVATLSVRHLILQVSGQMTGRVLGMKWADWLAPRIYEIWPFNGSLIFMPEPMLTERGLDLFADALGDDA